MPRRRVRSARGRAGKSGVLSDAQAVIVWLDNGPWAINADFYPTRMDAQKVFAESYARFTLAQNDSNCVGLGSMCELDFGLRCPLTRSMPKLSEVVRSIDVGRGGLDIGRALLAGFLSIQRVECAVGRQLALIGSDSDVSDDDAARLGVLLRQGSLDGRTLGVDVVLFGRAAWPACRLRTVFGSLPGCRVLDVGADLRTVLSDEVFQRLDQFGAPSIPDGLPEVRGPGLAPVLVTSGESKAEDKRVMPPA